MAGLLRKVRHLELRMLRIQELTNSGRVWVKFIPGSRNPSDSLTKDGDILHLNLLIQAIGLEVDPHLELLTDSCEHLLDRGQGLNRQSYSRVLDCLEKAMAGLDLGDVSVGTSDCQEVVESEECDMSEVLMSFRAIPKRWDSLLKRKEPLRKFRQSLSKWCQGYRPMVVEICCQEDSSMKSECRRLSIPYIGITEHDDICDAATCLMLRYMLDFRGPICFWVASPCTAGAV